MRTILKYLGSYLVHVIVLIFILIQYGKMYVYCIEFFHMFKRMPLFEIEVLQKSAMNRVIFYLKPARTIKSTLQDKRMSDFLYSINFIMT